MSYLLRKLIEIKAFFILRVVCSALPDDYSTPEQIDKIEEEYRNNHWCPSCLAMFEEECICGYDEDE